MLEGERTVKSQTQMLVQEIMGSASSAPDFLAEWSIVRHYGGMRATRELADLCHVTKDSSVLNVGCGMGITARFLAKQYGCKVIGIDPLARMIDRCQELAKEEGVNACTVFRVADGRTLPFPDEQFDVVLCESVNEFIEEKQQAMREYVRVTRPGGYVGMNESTWIKEPFPPELVAFLYYSRMERMMILEPYGWKGLLVSAGLDEIVAHTYEISRRKEVVYQLELIGVQEFLRMWARMLNEYVLHPSRRDAIRNKLHPPQDYFTYVGYGIYAGKKQVS
jgi:arsenite methyltransferase